MAPPGAGAPLPPPGANAPLPPPGPGAQTAPPGYQPYPPPYPYGGYPYPYGYYPPPYQHQSPTPAQPTLPPLRRNDTTMMVSGIALTFTGAAASVASALLMSFGTSRYTIYCSPGGGSVLYACRDEDDVGLVAAGWVTLGVSIAAMGAGIPLWIIGGKRVVATATKEPEKTSREHAPGPTVTLGLGSASARFAF
ncbi:hypothetical protein [Chondromyces apiculatus]|nr:hypothetical protein [Chondromyces apiculatus]